MKNLCHKFIIFTLPLNVFGAALGAGILVPDPARAETKKEWKASLYGRSTDDTFSSSKVVGLEAALRFQHDLAESLKARLEGGARLETGSSSSLFTNEFEPESRLFLREASLDWNAVGDVHLSAGALPQASSPLLVSGTFPAVSASLQPEWSHWILRLEAESAIPTSSTLSTRSTGKEPTPLFLTQTVETGWHNKKGLKAAVQLTHFQFRDLTRGIAQDSRFYGNTVTGIGPASRFVHQYEGFEGGPEIQVPLGESFRWTIGGKMVQNTKGPKNANLGQYGFTELKFEAEKFSLAPKFEAYRNEADSAPAYYTAADFGHNNRTGFGSGIRFEAPGFVIDLTLRRTKLIESRTFQKDKFEFYQIGLEIPYAGF